MLPGESSIEPALQSLCPRVCVHCDYALEGLPLNAVCPECGEPPEPGVLSLSGWDQPPPQAFSQWHWILQWVFYGAYVLWLLWSSRWTSFTRFQLFIFFGPTLIPLAILKAQAFMRNIEGPPMRLRFSPAGFQRRLGPGPLKLAAWDRTRPVEIKQLRGQLMMIRQHWSGEFWQYRPAKDPLTFYFSGTLEHAEALRAALNRWITAAPSR